MKTQASVSPLKARARSVEPIDFDTFLQRFGEKDRKSILRHVTAIEEKLGAQASARWRRLACVLLTLAPYPPKLIAQHSLQFYVPDGKYRRQVFALETSPEGALTIYAINVLADAVRTGILSKPREEGEQTVYTIKGSDDTLAVRTMDGQTPDPAPIYKAMTGWNRKAICISLPLAATSAQIDAVENVCALAATQWPAPQPAAEPPSPTSAR